MLRSLDPLVVASAKTSGATFQVLDYHWEPGDEIVDCDSLFRVRWRESPHQLRARGGFRPGEEQRFGTLMLHAADVPTYAHATDKQEDTRVLVCRFERGWMARLTEKKIDLDYSDLHTDLDLNSPHVDFAMRRLMSEILYPGLASDALIESLALLIASDLLRYYTNERAESATRNGLLSARRLRQINDFIAEYNDGCPSLSEVARECGVTAAHLRRLYKATAGKTLYEYIEEVRVERAIKLLRDTDIPLKVISYRLGFSHPSGFSFAFKRATGESPRDFRLRHEKRIITIN